MKKLISSLAIYLLPACLYGQQVTLGYDTINIITVATGSAANKQIYTSTPYFFIRNQYYYAANFPFSSMQSHCNVKNDSLFYFGFTPLIDQKSNKKLMSVLSKSVIRPIDYYLAPTPEYPGSPELLRLLAGLKKDPHKLEFFVKEQRIIAAYLILDCETPIGFGSPLYCQDMVISNRLPVILNAMQILK